LLNCSWLNTSSLSNVHISRKWAGKIIRSRRELDFKKTTKPVASSVHVSRDLLAQLVLELTDTMKVGAAHWPTLAE